MNQLHHALEARRAQGRLNGKEDLIEAIMEGSASDEPHRPSSRSGAEVIEAIRYGTRS